MDGDGERAEICENQAEEGEQTWSRNIKTVDREVEAMMVHTERECIGMDKSYLDQVSNDTHVSNSDMNKLVEEGLMSHCEGPEKVVGSNKNQVKLCINSPKAKDPNIHCSGLNSEMKVGETTGNSTIE